MRARCLTAAALLAVSAGLPVFRLEGVWGFSGRCGRHSGGVRASDLDRLRDCPQLAKL